MIQHFFNDIDAIMTAARSEKITAPRFAVPSVDRVYLYLRADGVDLRAEFTSVEVVRAMQTLGMLCPAPIIRFAGGEQAVVEGTPCDWIAEYLTGDAAQAVAEYLRRACPEYFMFFPV